MFALLLLMWCTASPALDGEVALPDLARTLWGPKEGSPASVYALVQTSDGYLWMGNPSGIFRFDGLRFERFEPPRNDKITSLGVYSMFAPPSGGLWIGFTFGGVEFVKDGQFTVYGEIDGLPPGSVKSIAQDADGAIWAGTSSGLAKLENSRWRRYGPGDGYAEQQTTALMLDSAGTLWATSFEKVLFLPRGDKRFHELPARAPGTDPLGIAESPNGEVWLGNFAGMQRLRKNLNAAHTAHSSQRVVLFDHDDNMWLSTEKRGVQRLGHAEGLALGSAALNKAPGDVQRRGGGVPDNSGVGGLLQDREGNVWAASDAGLERISPRNVRPGLPIDPGKADDIELARFSLLSASDGNLWISRRPLPPIEIVDGQPLLHPEVATASCAFQADDGALWFASADGIWRYASRRFEKISRPESAGNFELQAMATDRSGDLWISVVRRGVFRAVRGVWTPFGGNPALPKLTAITLAKDAKGRLWFGYAEGRMAVLDGDKVSVFSDTTRLSIGNVTAIYGKRKQVWAGGEFGLALFDGVRFRTLSSSANDTFTNITGLVEAADGSLWLNSDAGIVHLSPEQVRRVTDDPGYKVAPEVFDALDGVQGSSARLRPLPTAIEDGGGRLWFIRDADVYSIDGARIARNLLAPPVTIRSLTADGRAYAPEPGLKLPPRTDSLRIDYVGLSLTVAERVRYRYKLDGVDNGWQDAQTRRQAYYTNLSPGHYRFQVLAANNDGVWNETGATLDFVIAPTFFQTGWFIALCVIGSLTAIWSLVRIRVHQVASKMRARHETRTAERERIARELHDTLLQSTQVLILQIQAATKDIPRGTSTRGKVDQALDLANEAMAEGRDRVFDLRLATDTTVDLPQALAAAGQEIAQDGSANFKASVEGAPRELVPAARDEAYRIGREALLNAFRHADASLIEVHIVYSDEALHVRILDDGAGIAPDIIDSGSRPGHWGLRGMRERAGHLGGYLDIRRRAPAGTEIELSVPAAMAYRETLSRGGWRRLLRRGRIGE